MNLEKSVKRKKDVQDIDLHGEAEKFVIFIMDGVYAENAGAIFCHLIGDETFFSLARRIKSLYRLS